MGKMAFSKSKRRLNNGNKEIKKTRYMCMKKEMYVKIKDKGDEDKGDKGEDFRVKS